MINKFKRKYVDTNLYKRFTGVLRMNISLDFEIIGNILCVITLYNKYSFVCLV